MKNSTARFLTVTVAVVVLLVGLVFTGNAEALTSTITTVSSNSPNNTFSFGASVNFTAKVTPTAATGTVTFYDGMTTLGTGTLSGGTATYTTSALAAGTHSNITAAYGGDVTYSASTSLAITQTVTKSTVPPLTFTAKVEYDTGDNPYSIITGDFNGDGKLDLAAASFGSGTVSVLLGNGDSTFAANVDYGVGTYPSSVTSGDFNGDGKLDLATANYDGNTVSVLLGNGDGTFAAKVDYDTGINPILVITGDFNGDGKLDLAVANNGSNTVSVLLGNGEGTFAAKVDYGTGANPYSVATGDFNGDGSLDLATANYNISSVSVLLGNGDGTFAAKVDYGTGNYPVSITAGDFNGDWKLDLAVANNGNATVSVLLGNGDGTFAAKMDYGTGTSPNAVTTGDFSGDGKLDLATANYNISTVSVLLGNGDGAFAVKVDYSTGSYPVSVTTGDFNSDGRQDLALADYYGASLSVLMGSSFFQTVTAISSNHNPSSYGSSVTFTATVSPSVAAGTVTFFDGANSLGTGALSGGTAMYSSSALTLGSHSITATYGGSASYAASTSTAITQTVIENTPPSSAITAPTNGATLSGGSYTITGTASDEDSGVQRVEVSINGGKSWSIASGTDSWSYEWDIGSAGPHQILSKATDNAGSAETPGAGVTVNVSATGSPELQHYNWNAILSGGSCNACHTTTNAFLMPGFRNDNSFCYSCHNAAGVSHEKGLYGNNHSTMVNATSLGAEMPTYGTITTSEFNNQPFSRLNAGKVVCVTCHNPMRKSDDMSRTWEYTTTSDNLTYTMQNGGWAGYKNLVPKVYRDTSLWAGPTYSKTKKNYLVDPSEYTYNEDSGTITFLSLQNQTAYIYVSLDYPYLRASNADNTLCSDCHTQTTHKSANCQTCHTAHNTGNIKGIRESLRAPNRTSVSVKFMGYTGANSFTDGDQTHDGICEVCHTQTKYYRRDGSGFANHSGGADYNGKDCTSCHPHITGFGK